MQDISHFGRVSDYLPMTAAVLVTETVFLLLIVGGVIQSRFLKQWYLQFSVAAVMADVLIILIGLLLTRLLYRSVWGVGFSVWRFWVLAVAIQVTHDLLFAALVTYLPRGKNRMVDVFKDYAKEMSWLAIVGDSCMTTLAVFLSSWYAGWSVNGNILLLVVTLYVIPYLINQV